MPFYELMPEVAALTRNVVYDTAASSYLYRADVFRAVLDIAGPERVLWASDHPVLGMGRFLRPDATAGRDPPRGVGSGHGRQCAPRLPARQYGDERRKRGDAEMIAGLKGRIERKLDDAALIDVGGVIYRVNTSLRDAGRYRRGR